MRLRLELAWFTIDLRLILRDDDSIKVIEADGRVVDINSRRF